MAGDHGERRARITALVEGAALNGFIVWQCCFLWLNGFWRKFPDFKINL